VPSTSVTFDVALVTASPSRASGSVMLFIGYTVVGSASPPTWNFTESNSSFPGSADPVSAIRPCTHDRSGSKCRSNDLQPPPSTLVPGASNISPAGTCDPSSRISPEISWPR
jgi:hypothetical protein